MATNVKDPKQQNTAPLADGVSIHALGAAFNAGNPVQTTPLDNAPDARPLFELLGDQNKAVTAPQGDVAFGLTDALGAVTNSFRQGKPAYDRPGSINSRVVGASFDDAASQRTVGSVLAGKLNVPTVENLRLGDPVAGKERISSHFGMRNHPVLGGHRQHHGIDLAAPIGTDIQAAGTGVVAFSGQVNGYGNTIVLLHHDKENGYSYTLYAHNQKNLVRVGQTVESGQHIAELGRTGRVTGPHLHFEAGRILDNGQAIEVNPVATLQGGLSAERMADMTGGKAGTFVSGLLNRLDIQVAQAEGPKMQAPALVPN